MDGRVRTGVTSRRAFLQSAGAFGLLAVASAGHVEELLAAGPRPGQDGRFLDAHEMDTLRSLCARLIPGPPDDPDPGAIEAQAPEAIDMLLAAFEFDPPLIHTGGPWSTRGGARRNDFKRFVRLDRPAELAWRIRIEGTRGIPEREFAGPVAGLQEIYQKGLARLDARAKGLGAADFKSTAKTLQDAILADKTDAETQHFVGAAFSNALEAMYGPPEYGGNHDLAGWRYTGWDGDTSPRGFSEQELAERDDTTGPRSDRANAALLADFERYIGGVGGRATPRDEFWRGFRGMTL